MSCLAALGAGCGGGPEGAAPEAVGETSQAFAGYWSASWGTAGAQGRYDIDLNLSAATTTCFLTAVGGSLSSSINPYDRFGRGAFAGVAVENGTWHLITENSARSDSSEVQASTVCFPSAKKAADPVRVLRARRAEYLRRLAGVEEDRQHLVTSIQNTEYGYLNLWASSNDYAYVFNDGSNWYLGGNGNVEAQAACVDRSPGGGYAAWGIGGTGTWNLVQSIDSGTHPLGTQCYLAGVGGPFTDPSSYTDGAYVSYAPGTHWWSLTMNNKSAWPACLQ